MKSFSEIPGSPEALNDPGILGKYFATKKAH